MKIMIQDLGALDYAEFSLGNLTMICGSNNTGKTYATYALFGFLRFWQNDFSVSFPQDQVQTLLNEGSIEIDLCPFIKNSQSIMNQASEEYLNLLPKVFSAPLDRFKNSKFNLEIFPKDITILDQYRWYRKTINTDLLLIKESQESTVLTVNMLRKTIKLPFSKEILQIIIGQAIKSIIFGRVVPNPFIVSAERTGAAIFRKELDFARNRLLEHMGQHNSSNIDPTELLTTVYHNYPLPVHENINFIRQLESLTKEASFIATEHEEVLADFAEIIGGEYTVGREDELRFIPRGKQVKLSIDESSSSVRSLLDLGFYLRHVATPGDLLMIDEPELNLHPENQRRVARLFARLTNLGLRVFVTTHSDYIIKELNTLIMLAQDTPRMCEIAKREGYQPNELLSSDTIKVYIAEKALVDLQDGGRAYRHTLTPADISPTLGIELHSFDATIDEMNRIQEEIIWGDD